MEVIRKTFNFVGVYKFTHSNGELIEGYQYDEVNKNNKDKNIPIIKVECEDGYFYTTNYKDDVEKHL